MLQEFAGEGIPVLASAVPAETFYSHLNDLLPLIMNKAVSLTPPFLFMGTGGKKKKSSTSNLHCSCFSSMTLSLPLACRSLPARWQIVPSLWARLARHCTPWLVCQEAGLSQESCPIGCCPCSWLVLETVMQRCAITVCSAWEL